MEYVKFCNISKITSLGIKPGKFIAVTRSKANELCNKAGSKMGSTFIILPLGQSMKPPKIKEIIKEKPKKWQKKS